MKISKMLYVTNRKDWRKWLERHHQSESEIWLIYYKKHTGRPRIPYDDAVEEALCFGWIDSTVKKIDDDKYAQRFTPRKAKSQWSELNIIRVKKLIAEGRMASAGLGVIDQEILKSDESDRTNKSKALVIPDYFKEAITTNLLAWDNFNNLAPSYKRAYVRWVTEAKREETRARRLKEAVALIAANKKPVMK